MVRHKHCQVVKCVHSENKCYPSRIQYIKYSYHCILRCLIAISIAMEMFTTCMWCHEMALNADNRNKDYGWLSNLPIAIRIHHKLKLNQSFI